MAEVPFYELIQIVTFIKFCLYIYYIDIGLMGIRSWVVMVVASPACSLQRLPMSISVSWATHVANAGSRI